MSVDQGISCPLVGLWTDSRLRVDDASHASISGPRGGSSFFLVAFDCAYEADALSHHWMNGPLPTLAVHPVNVKLNVSVIVSHCSPEKRRTAG